MKFVVRWAFRLVILLVVLAVAAVLLKDALLKSLTEHRLRTQSGLDVRIGKLEIGLLTPTITFDNFRIYNPVEFGGSPFIDLPELHVEYDRGALAAGKLHMILVRLNVAEINIVKNKAGQSNLEVLQARLKQKAAGNLKTSLEFAGINVLNLSVGKIKLTDLNRPSQVQEVNIGLKNEILRNVKSEMDLVGLMGKIMLLGGKSLFDGRAAAAEPSAKAPGKGKGKLPPPESPSAPFRK